MKFLTILTTKQMEADLQWLDRFAYSDLIAKRPSSCEHDELVRIYYNYQKLARRVIELEKFGAERIEMNEQ